MDNSTSDEHKGNAVNEQVGPGVQGGPAEQGGPAGQHSGQRMTVGGKGKAAVENHDGMSTTTRS